MEISKKEIQEIIKAVSGSNLPASKIIELIKKNNVQNKEEILQASEITEENFLEEFWLPVDFDKFEPTAIREGNYSDVHSGWKNIWFGTPKELKDLREIELIAKLFKFNCDISFQNACKEINKAGYDPALIPELLAFGALNQKLQLKFKILALGVSADRLDFGPCVPCIFSRDNKRELGFYRTSLDSDKKPIEQDCLFLAIKKGIKPVLY